MENLLLNLSILNKIPQKGRLGLDKNGIISIEDDVLYKSITRFLLGISRTDALNSIDSIIKIAKEKIDDLINSKWLDNSSTINIGDTNNKFKEKKNELFNLKEHLISSVSGIENLKHTYRDDMYTILKIDSYIKKILSLVDIINDNESKKY